MADLEAALELARRFDLFDPELREDPYPTYAELREACPVARSETYGGYWIFSSYEDIFEALRNPSVYSSRQLALTRGQADKSPSIPIGLDPPEHAKYRRILAEHFSLPKVRELEPQIREVATRLFDEIARKGRCEFIEDFAIPLPAEVFLRLMGLPQDDLPQFLVWVHQMVREGLSSDGDAEKRSVEESRPAVQAYFREVVRARRGASEQPDDVMGLLLSARLEGERLLTEEEILRICGLLLLAGLDTTASVLSVSVAFLATHPEHKARLLAEPAKIPDAVEELLRYESIVSQARLVTQDVEVRGIKIRAGERVLMLPGSAGRDPARFENPDEVDFDRRTASRHLAFGAGPHRCLGMHLARLELCVALEELHRRFPDYRVTDTAEIQRRNGHVRGVDRLPLVVDGVN